MELTQISARLIGVYGSDESIAGAAWTSTGQEISDEMRQRIPGLLHRLAEGSDGNEHGTPLEFSMLHFQIESDIATHIQLLKHRVGVSVNSESARYREFREDRFYVPKDWPVHLQRRLIAKCEADAEAYHEAASDLIDCGFSRSRAKESARYFLPYARVIRQQVAMNLRSFAHFQKLRNAPGAQREIRQLAELMFREVLASGAFAYALIAFFKNQLGQYDA